MANLYVWLKFLHVAGLAVFLVGHGASAGASLALRRPLAGSVRGFLLQLSMRANYAAFPGLLVIVVTGVWMGFLGSWWRWGWIWAAIVVLVAVSVMMSASSVPYHGARDAVKENLPEGELESRLKRARPLALLWVGAAALLILLLLMVFKPF